MNLAEKLKAKASLASVDLFPNLSEAERHENKIQVAIALKISSRRKSLGYSQKDLAKKLGISQAMISQFESGDYNFTIGSLCRIMDALGLSVSFSFNETENFTRRNNFKVIPEGNARTEIRASEFSDLFDEEDAIA